MDKVLIEKAKVLVGKKKVTGGVVKEVGSALLTQKGKIFTGVSLDLWCGVGFCAFLLPSQKTQSELLE